MQLRRSVIVSDCSKLRVTVQFTEIVTDMQTIARVCICIKLSDTIAILRNVK